MGLKMIDHFFHFFTPAGCGEHMAWPAIAAAVSGSILWAKGFFTRKSGKDGK